jgi:plastocyanin
LPAAAAGTNVGWLIADDVLHTVSLEDGSVTGSWPLPAAAGGVRDLTILSGM